jgi:outer membrane immunogenic protein
MKSRSLLVSFATLIALTAAPAMAADMRAPVKAPPPAIVAPAFNWSGFYIGAHVGGAWSDKDWPLTSSNGVFLVFPGFPHFGSHDVKGFIAGGQVGFNWQASGSNWVLGVEAQASWSNADGEHTVDVFRFRTEVEWLGTVTGRLGYAFDRVLVYAKGGFAFAHDKHELAVFTDPTLFTDKTRTGWTVGGGVELALWQNWSAKLEYNYMDLGRKDVTFSDGVTFMTFDVDQQMHVVKFGINYRFGGSPVVARY